MFAYDAAALVRASTHLESAARNASAALDHDMPLLFGRLRAIREIRSTLAAAASDARLAIRALDFADDGLATNVDVIRGVANSLDPALRPRIWRQRDYRHMKTAPHALRQHAESLRLLAGLEHEAPAAARTRMQVRLDELVDRPWKPGEHADRAALLEAGSISLLPEPYRPDLATTLYDYHRLSTATARTLASTADGAARIEFANQRFAATARRMAADPTTTREGVETELRALLSLADDQVTHEHNERLATLVRLPDELRPELLDTPMPRSNYGPVHIAAQGWLPSKRQEGSIVWETLRLAVERERMLLDPATTRESVMAELFDLIAVPDADLTHAQLRRISVLAHLPEHLRPAMPVSPIRDLDFANLGVLGRHPADNVFAAEVMDHARSQLLAELDPDRAAMHLREAIESGTRFDIRVAEALDAHPLARERAGLTDELLHRAAIETLASAGGHGRSESLQLRTILERMRERVADAAPVDEGVAAARDEALELIDRNVGRMSGARSDTYGRHPDYAEIGRIASIARVLDAVDRPAASGVAETLTW